MSWLDRLSVEEHSRAAETDHQRGDADRMSPGLTGKYDSDLREKAGVHIPPPPPECMGVEGEYDDSGLAKRVAIALDSAPKVSAIDTLSIVQAGSTIRFLGSAPSQELLHEIVEVAAEIDGTKSIDVSQVKIRS